MRGCACLMAPVVLAGALLPQAAPEARPHGLRPGEFHWTPERSAAGPVVIIVSLPAQDAHVYRNGIEIGVATVSTGRATHPTPTGVFTILQKKVEHRSNLYDNAPMPYMERLTWDGVALHAGNLPGYPASHGCIRLPPDFARLLYGVTGRGTTVVVAGAHADPAEVVNPGSIVPHLDGIADSATARARLAPQHYRWTPEKAPEGPVSILVSGADRMVYVYRNGVAIGSAGIDVRPADAPLDAGVFAVLDGAGLGPNPWAPERPAPRWLSVTLGAGDIAHEQVFGRVRVPGDFARHLATILEPGTTLYITPEAVTAATTTSADFTVMADRDEMAPPPPD